MPLPSLQSRTIAIAGGGIGGLAAAVALARVGFRSIVIEKSPRFETFGAGLQLTPNATRALARLGLFDQVAAIASEPQGMVVRSGSTGKDILRVALGPAVTRRFGRPWLVAHRADLQTLLAEAASATFDVEVRLGSTVEDFAVHARGVTVAGMRGARGFEETGAALIGADGLWSNIRQRAIDSSPPVWSNRTAWRAVVPRDRLPEPLTEPWSGLWLGPDAHLVHYPIRGGREVNIVAVVDDTYRAEAWRSPGDPKQIAARFARWCDMVQAVIATPTEWTRWALADRAPLAAWGAGAQTLLGDSAHPMLPFLAQGAAMAFEDAVVLANEVAGNPTDLPAALRTYERRRAARVARVQQEARHNGVLYHLGGIGALFRDMTLRTRGDAGLLNRYAWLFDWRPDMKR